MNGPLIAWGITLAQNKYAWWFVFGLQFQLFSYKNQCGRLATQNNNQEVKVNQSRETDPKLQMIALDFCYREANGSIFPKNKMMKGFIIRSGELRRGLMSLFGFVPPQRHHRHFFRPPRAAGGADSWRDHQLYPCIRGRLQANMLACSHLLLLPLMLPGEAEALRGPLCQMWSTGSVRVYPRHRCERWGVLFYFGFQLNKEAGWNTEQFELFLPFSRKVRIEEDIWRKCIMFYFRWLEGLFRAQGFCSYMNLKTQ